MTFGSGDRAVIQVTELFSWGLYTRHMAEISYQVIELARETRHIEVEVQSTTPIIQNKQTRDSLIIISSPSSSLFATKSKLLQLFTPAQLILS